MKRRFGCSCLCVLTVLVLSACATVMPEIDPPKVSLASFKALPADTGAPRFEVRLRVQNPNARKLDIAGISYGVEVSGRELISGVSNDIPVIEGYSEEIVSLQAGLQLFELLRLLTSVGAAPTDALHYRFKAKIDFNGLVPTQYVEDSGDITLR